MRAIRCLLDRDAKRLGNLRAQGIDRLGGVDGERPTHEVVRIEVAERDVGVGDRGRGPAHVVADGAGLGTRALGPHLHGTTCIDGDERAAARAHLGEVDGGHPHQVARAGQEPRAGEDAGPPPGTRRSG